MRLALVFLVAASAAACTGREAPLTFGVTPEEHDPSFPIGAGTKHALGRSAADGPIACASCHAGAASFRDFSCLGCHEHRAEQMNGVHRGLEQYRFESPRCLQCHPRGNTDGAIDDATHTERYFPIDDGSAHQAISCSECHPSPGDRSIVGCTSCHQHQPLAMQEVHGPMPGYLWDSPACLGCHDRAQNPGALSHPFFPTDRGAKHERITCTECHASRQDRTAMACITCHEHERTETDGQHQGVPEYAYDSGSCVLCHRQAQVPGVIQHTFFPIDPPATHALGTPVDNAGFSPNTTVSCASCHTEPTDRAAIGCLDCHAHAEDVLATTHAAIPGYAWTTNNCLFCHPNGEPTGYVDHTRFPIAAGTVHAPVSCNECHASPTNRSLLTCTSCHEHRIEAVEPPHRGMPGYAFDSAACFNCHDSAQVPGRFDHEPLFPLQAPSTHTGLACRDCHTNPLTRSQLSCTSCHLGTHDQQPMAQTHQDIANYSWTPVSCLGCHPTGSADNVVFSHPYFPIAQGSVHGTYSCVDCHTTPGDNTKVSCTTCHLGAHDLQPMTARHAAVSGFSWDTAQCLFCHPNGEPTGNIDHELYFPLRAPAAHAPVACADCHLDPANRLVVGCAECHAGDSPAMPTVHTGVPGFANTSSACLQCHRRAEPTGTIDHNPWFPIAAGTAHGGSVYAAKVASTENSCTACHLSRTDRKRNDCAACHAGVAPVPTTAHTRVNGFVNNSTNCKQCHADAQIDRLVAHTAFSPRHEGARCIDCHRNFRADKPFGIDFDRADCVACHVPTCTVSNRRPCD
jgi:hypothetical protein